MSNTSIILPQFAIFLVSFLPACMCYMLVSRFGPIWTREGLPAEEIRCSSQLRILKKSNIVIKELMNTYL